MDKKQNEGVTLNFNAPIYNNGGTISGNVTNYYGRGNGGGLTAEELRKRIDSVMPFMKNATHWFSIAKVLMIVHEVGDGDFNSAVRLISEAYPEGVPMGIDARQLSALDCMSMRHSPEEWDRDNSPVKRGFSIYHTIALRFLHTFNNTDPQP